MKTFTLDGEPVSIGQFIIDNAETMAVEDLDAIDALKVGEAITYGGGAAATFVLKREEDIDLDALMDSHWSAKAVKPVSVKPRRAYTAVLSRSSDHWQLGICEEGSPGYFEVKQDSDAGGEFSEREARELAQRFNERLGLSLEDTAIIVASTFVGRGSR